MEQLSTSANMAAYKDYNMPECSYFNTLKILKKRIVKIVLKEQKCNFNFSRTLLIVKILQSKSIRSDCHNKLERMLEYFLSSNALIVIKEGSSSREFNLTKRNAKATFLRSVLDCMLLFQYLIRQLPEGRNDDLQESAKCSYLPSGAW